MLMTVNIRILLKLFTKTKPSQLEFFNLHNFTSAKKNPVPKLTNTPQ